MSDERNLSERFWEFFEQNSQQLLRFAGWHATPDYPAEDLLQDAFLFAWERLDPEKCDKWLAWLRTIIVRKKIDHRRRSKRVVLAGDITTDENTDLMASSPDEQLSPRQLAEQLGDTQLVKQALEGMRNQEQRRVLELVLDNFATYGEHNLTKVAKDMNILYDNCKKLYERARKALKHSLSQLAEDMNIPTERPSHEP